MVAARVDKLVALNYSGCQKLSQIFPRSRRAFYKPISVGFSADAFLQLLSKRVGIVLKPSIQCQTAPIALYALRVRVFAHNFCARDTACVLIEFCN